MNNIKLKNLKIITNNYNLYISNSYINSYNPTISLFQNNNNAHYHNLLLSSGISHFSTTAVSNNNIILIDKGLWKVLILPFNSFDTGVKELFNDFKSDKNYALLIQGNYHNQFISIGPKIFINKQTSKEFIHEYLQYYLDLLSTENYDVDNINDIIFRYRDTEILTITQPNLPQIDKVIKPIIPKSFLFEKYFPASANNDNFGEILNVSQNEKGQDIYTFEYNKFTIIRTQVNNNLFHNEVRLGEKPFTSFIDQIFESGPDYHESYFVRTINEKFNEKYLFDKINYKWHHLEDGLWIRMEYKDFSTHSVEFLREYENFNIITTSLEKEIFTDLNRKSALLHKRKKI
jgi:hypothetical protein